MLETVIVSLAWLSIVAPIVALGLLCVCRKAILGRDAGWLLALLLVLSALHGVSNLGEWTSTAHSTKPLEDFFLLLLPAVWGTFFYVFLREHSRAELHRSEARYRSLTDDVLDTTSAGIFILDASRHVVWINQAVEDYFQLKRLEIVGRDYSRLIEDRLKHMVEDPHGWASEMLGAWNCTEPVELECHILAGQSRQERWLECRIQPIRSGLYEGGRIEHFYDITERKNAAAQRERLFQVLEAQKAELERFVYTISHDLKTPLITIKGFLGVAEENLSAGETDEVRSDLDRVETAATRMQRLLDELLELARVGRETTPPSPVDLSVVIAEALELLQPTIRSRGVTVKVHDGAPRVWGNHTRLVEVFQNLIDNSIKYFGDQTSPCIEIDARTREEEAVCFVRDNGLGIDSAYRIRVFELFEQLDPECEGTGIGLAIVKRIVETHGGRIWVESKGRNRGATFWFTLPIQPAGVDLPEQVIPDSPYAQKLADA